jgi:hypothetical protein
MATNTPIIKVRLQQAQAREINKRERGRRKVWVFGASCSRRGRTQTPCFRGPRHRRRQGCTPICRSMPEFTSFAFDCPLPLVKLGKDVGTNAGSGEASHHITPHHITTQHNTTHHTTTHHNTTQHNTTLHNTTQHYTTLHNNTAQHNTTQQNTI